jgi:hypothetical protein
MKPFFTGLLLCMVCAASWAQEKQTTYTTQFWTTYQPQFRLSKHWGLWSDIEVHSKDDDLSAVSQTVYRIGVTYYATDLCKITAGYGFSNYYPGDNHKNISLPEHHGWQQLQWYTYLKKKKLMQWLRLEERFRRNVIDDNTLANTYTFTYRARYNCFYVMPLTKKGIVAHSLSAVIADELYINFGKNIVNNYFDQNRMFAGFSYAVNSHDNLVFGYMNVFQELSSGYQYKNLNLIRLSFFENIDLRKKVLTLSERDQL